MVTLPTFPKNHGVARAMPTGDKAMSRSCSTERLMRGVSLSAWSTLFLDGRQKVIRNRDKAIWVSFLWPLDPQPSGILEHLSVLTQLVQNLSTGLPIYITIWRFPKMEVPQIIYFKRIFHYKPSSVWGTAIYGSPHVSLSRSRCSYHISSIGNFGS